MFLTKTRAPYHPIAIMTWTAPFDEVASEFETISTTVYDESQLRVPTYTNWPEVIATYAGDVVEPNPPEYYREPWWMDPEKESKLLPWLQEVLFDFASKASDGSGSQIQIFCIPMMCLLDYDETNRQHVDEFIGHVFDYCAQRAFVVVKQEADGQMSINLTTGYGVFHAFNDILEKIKKQSPAFLPGGALWPWPNEKHPDIHPAV